MSQQTITSADYVAPRVGTTVGVMWIISFILIINSFAVPALSFVGLAIGLFSIVFIALVLYLTRSFHPSEVKTFGKHWFLALKSFVYASILMAMGMYLYMQFLDNGQFSETYQQLMTSPANKQLLEEMVKNSGITADEMITQLTTLKPISFAVNVMVSNILMGFILSVPLTFIARIPRINNNKQQ